MKILVIGSINMDLLPMSIDFLHKVKRNLVVHLNKIQEAKGLIKLVPVL